MRVFGVLALLLATLLGALIVYQVMSGAPNMGSPLGAAGFCAILLFFGVHWLRGTEASPPNRELPPARIAPDAAPIRELDTAKRPSQGIDINLSDFSAAGWLLFVTTVAFVGVQVTCWVLWFPDLDKQPDGRRWRTVLSFAMLGLTIGFFLLGKFILARLGFPIYRQRGK
jgi:hypothetical protein